MSQCLRVRRSAEAAAKLEVQCSSAGSNQTNAPQESSSAQPSAKETDSQNQQASGACHLGKQPSEGQLLPEMLPFPPEPVPRIDCSEDINELVNVMRPMPRIDCSLDIPRPSNTR
eukprot:TRINITY_DN1898_c0_g1_i1.p1 TRINITY_DN1898_c0_g1~~TRINITY_DN1898_c0_g1_i1.p1  ORF type:complete len:115 (-),score=27.34 TRINITY_DN1898_c0_g1_i1:13-357(-)